MPGLPEVNQQTAQVVFDKLLGLVNASPGKEAALEVTLNTGIAEIGLDSLRLLEIVFELERCFDVEVDEALLAEVTTVSDLVTMIVQAHVVQETVVREKSEDCYEV